MEIKLVSEKDLESVFPIFAELRTGLNLSRFLQISKEAQDLNQYKIYGLYDGQKCLAVMGLRILCDLVHGRHVYIDDLVVTENQRGKRLGPKLLEFAEEIAKQNKCEGLRLCTGVDNLAAKSFYEREGWKARAFAFKKKIQ